MTDKELSDATIESAFEFLDANIEPVLQTAGELYMRMLSAPLNVDDDGELSIRSEAGSRRGGEFYTPQHVVDYCLEQIDWSSFDGKTVLDPACGSGNFLLGALRKCSNPLQTVRRLHGFDIDGRAVCLARILLLIGARAPSPAFVEETFSILRNNMRILDATTLPVDRNYDLVITNPPYLSFGSRNQPAMAKSQDLYLRTTFPASAQYKIRVHSLFQEIALRLVEPGGEAILLLPDAFLTGAYYEKLRKYICQKANVVSFTELPESTFADATAGRWCVAHYRRKGDDETDRPRFAPPVPTTVPSVILRRFDEIGLQGQFEITQAQLVTPDKSRFQLVFHEADLRILCHLSDLPGAKQFFRGHTGIRARHGQASIIADQQNGPLWKRGITSGAQVVPQGIEWRGAWLHIKPELLFAGGFDERIISNAKVLVRQTADRLIGALDTDGFYHLNNVHSFAPLNASSPELCAFFASLVNSRLWLYLYQLKSREKKRALAQIDIEMVESLPMPPANHTLQKTIGIAGLASARLYSDQSVRAAVDRLIYDMYLLDASHVQRIEETIDLERDSAPLPSSEAAVNLLQSLASASV